MKNLIFTLLFLSIQLTSAFAQSEPEMALEDTNSDGTTSYALALGEPSDQDYKRMLFGLNKSSDGWLRMLTNHDLSFWTKNRKRVTIKNDGKIGIGTSTPLAELFIQNGRQGLETKTITDTTPQGLSATEEQTGIDFYTDNQKVGALEYNNRTVSGLNPGASSVSLENFNSGNVKIVTGGINRIVVGASGAVTLPDLVGSDTRNLVVNSFGTIQAGNTITPSSIYHVISPTHFENSLPSLGKLEYSITSLKADFELFSSSTIAISHLKIPITKYRVDEITVLFTDNSSSEDIEFTVNALFQDEVKFDSSDADIIPWSITQALGIVIDQEQGDQLTFCVKFNDEDEHRFHKAIIKYTPILD